MTSNINVTKLAAAERQLREAIRMFFEQRDELATHTVASAAYRILRDLLAKTGRNEAAEVLFAPIFYVVRDYRRGTLPTSFQTHPEVMKYVEELAQNFPMIKASHEFKDFEMRMDDASTKQYWDNFNNAANFLKHADRDPEGTLDPASIDNFQLLFAATAAYAGVAEKRLEPEFDVMMIYYGLEYGRIDYLEEYLQRFVEDMSKDLYQDQYLATCHALLTKLTESPHDVTEEGLLVRHVTRKKDRSFFRYTESELLADLTPEKVHTDKLATLTADEFGD